MILSWNSFWGTNGKPRKHQRTGDGEAVIEMGYLTDTN
jgi:hypothetical protein